MNQNATRLAIVKQIQNDFVAQEMSVDDLLIIANYAITQAKDRVLNERICAASLEKREADEADIELVRKLGEMHDYFIERK